VKGAKENPTIEQGQTDADQPEPIVPRDVSERVVPGNEIYSIVGSISLACTPLPQRDVGINFVLEKYLARTHDRLSLFHADNTFSGCAVICSADSECSDNLTGSTISIAEINKVVRFFTAPMSLFGGLQ
jgi:hypothetical protein